jgi:hypothetical protein
MSERGQYAIRDTFISLALSFAEDPGWVAQVCGTSGQMIFRQYRRWIPSLQVGAGRRINRLFEKTLRQASPQGASLKPSLRDRNKAKSQDNQSFLMVEAGGIEPPSEFGLTYRESA